MNFIDFLNFFIVLLSVLGGFKHGLLKELVYIFIWYIVYILYTKYYSEMIYIYIYVLNLFTIKNSIFLDYFFFFFLIFLMILGYFLKKIFQFFFNFLICSNFYLIDKFLGIIFGLFRGIILVSILKRIIKFF